MDCYEAILRPLLLKASSATKVLVFQCNLPQTEVHS